MTRDDLVALGKELAQATRQFVGDQIGAFGDRLKAMEERIATVKDGADGRDGVDGKDGIDGTKGIDGAAGRDGIDGKDGAPGQHGEPGAVGEIGPMGAKGDRGDRGESGSVGDVGPQGETGAGGEPGPSGPAGEPGPTGPAGEPGALGQPGEPGKAGSDGKSLSVDDIRPIVEAELAKAALEFERRAIDLVQRAVDRLPKPENGKDGKDGADGKDGFGFDELKFVQDTEREGRWIGTREGEEKMLGTMTVAGWIYRGVYVEGQKYAKGDAVTWAGSFWIANEATSAKPGLPTAESRAWTMAVRKGSDGKQGPTGPAGAPPKPVKA